MGGQCLICAAASFPYKIPAFLFVATARLVPRVPPFSPQNRTPGRSLQQLRYDHEC